ncbi:hypothetical protein IAT40_007087 [Kwoniella sp. CBS 6097]
MPLAIFDLLAEAREQVGRQWVLFPLGFVVAQFILATLNHRQSISNALSSPAASAVLKHLWFDVYLNVVDTSSAISHSVSHHVAHPLDNSVWDWLHSQWQARSWDIVHFGSSSRHELQPIKVVLEFVPDARFGSFAWTSVDIQHPAMVTLSYGIPTMTNAAVSPMVGPTPSPTGDLFEDGDFDFEFGGRFDVPSFGDYFRGPMLMCVPIVKSLKSKAKKSIAKFCAQVKTVLPSDLSSPDVLIRIVYSIHAAYIVLSLLLPKLFVLCRLIYNVWLRTTARMLLPILEPLVGYLRAALAPPVIQVPEAPAPPIVVAPDLPPALLAQPAPLAVAIPAPQPEVIQPAPVAVDAASPAPQAISPSPIAAPAPTVELELTSPAPVVTAASASRAEVVEPAAKEIFAELDLNQPAPKIAEDLAQPALAADNPTPSPAAAKLDLAVVDTADQVSKHLSALRNVNLILFEPNLIERSLSEPALSRHGLELPHRPTSASFLDLAASPTSPSTSLIDLLNAKEQAEQQILDLDTPLPSSATLPLDVYPPPSKSRYDFTLSHVSLGPFSLGAAPPPKSKRSSQSSAISESSTPFSSHDILAEVQAVSPMRSISPAARSKHTVPVYIAPPISPYVPWDKRPTQQEMKDDVPPWFTATRPDSPQLPSFRGITITGDRYTGACEWNDAEPAEMTDPNIRPTTSRHNKGRSVSPTQGKKLEPEPATSRSKKGFTFDASLFSKTSGSATVSAEVEARPEENVSFQGFKPFDFVLPREPDFFVPPTSSSEQKIEPSHSVLPFPFGAPCSLPSVSAAAAATSAHVAVPLDSVPPAFPDEATSPPFFFDSTTPTPRQSGTRDGSTAALDQLAASSDFFELPSQPYAGSATTAGDTPSMPGPFQEVKALWQFEQQLFVPDGVDFDLTGLMDDLIPAFPSPPADIRSASPTEQTSSQEAGASLGAASEEFGFSSVPMTPMADKSLEDQQDVQQALEERVHLLFGQVNAAVQALGSRFDPTRPWDPLPKDLWNGFYELFDAAQRVGLLLEVFCNGFEVSVGSTPIEDTRNAPPSPLSPVARGDSFRHSSQSTQASSSQDQMILEHRVPLLEVYNPHYSEQQRPIEIDLPVGTYEERPSHFKIVLSPIRSTFPPSCSQAGPTSPSKEVMPGGLPYSVPENVDKHEPRTPTQTRFALEEKLVTPENTIKTDQVLIAQQHTDSVDSHPSAAYSISHFGLPEPVHVLDFPKEQMQPAMLEAIIHVPEPLIQSHHLLDPLSQPIVQSSIHQGRITEDLNIPSSRISSPPPLPRSASVGATPAPCLADVAAPVAEPSGSPKDETPTVSSSVPEVNHTLTDIKMEQEENDDMDMVERMLSGFTISSPDLLPSLPLPSFPHPPKTALPPARKRTTPRYPSAKTAIKAIISPTRTKFSGFRNIEETEVSNGSYSGPREDFKLSSSCYCTICERARASEKTQDESDPGRSYAVPLYFDLPVLAESTSNHAESSAAVNFDSSSSSAMIAADTMRAEEGMQVDEESQLYAWSTPPEEPIKFVGKGKAKERGDKLARHSQPPKPPQSKRFKAGVSPVPTKSRRDAPDSDITMTELKGSAEDWVARISSFKSQTKPDHKKVKSTLTSMPHPQPFSKPRVEPPANRPPPPPPSKAETVSALGPSVGKSYASTAMAERPPHVESKTEGWTAVGPKRRRR